MRGILFRGWSENHKQWVYGYYFKEAGKSGKCYILNGTLQIGDVPKNMFEVVPESVGMFSGLTDRKKARLFEGDIVIAKGKKSVGDYISVVIFDEGKFKLKRNDTYFVDSASLKTSLRLGTIFENPELLEENI